MTPPSAAVTVVGFAWQVSYKMCPVTPTSLYGTHHSKQRHHFLDQHHHFPLGKCLRPAAKTLYCSGLVRVSHQLLLTPASMEIEGAPKKLPRCDRPTQLNYVT